MAYCKECGAYIPDGQEICLACGYDPNKKKTTKTDGGSAYQFDTTALKDELDRQRQRIKEESRKWAEQEAARRKAEQQQSRTAQEPKQENKTAASAAEMSQGTQNLLSAAAYLGIFFLVPWLLGGGREYTRFHAGQGFRLFLFGLAADIIAAIVPVGWILSLARLYFIFKGMSAALNGRMEPLPYIGKIGG